jgi:hypothetical protein
MNVRYENFIGMFENVYPDGYCNHMITEFERIRQGGHCGNRQSSENVTKTTKQDEFYFLNLKNHVVSSFNDKDSTRLFFDGLQKCFESYVNEYDILREMDLKCTSVKIQKTDPGAGYHVWHSEQGPNESGNRVLTYILYLNSLDENSAGETEFLYQRLRVPPNENSMVIWPAAYTHVHRGNVVHGTKSKYIITGWFYVE